MTIFAFGLRRRLMFGRPSAGRLGLKHPLNCFLKLKPCTEDSEGSNSIQSAPLHLGFAPDVFGDAVDGFAVREFFADRIDLAGAVIAAALAVAVVGVDFAAGIGGVAAAFVHGHAFEEALFDLPVFVLVIQCLLHDLGIRWRRPTAAIICVGVCHGNGVDVVGIVFLSRWLTRCRNEQCGHDGEQEDAEIFHSRHKLNRF